MIEEGELYPNGNLFEAKLKEGNGGLWYGKYTFSRGAAGHQEMSRIIEEIFWGKIDIGKGFMIGI